MKPPKLRQTSSAKPLYPLNSFPSSFAESVAEHIYAVKATSLFSGTDVDISGSLWEHIFATSVGARRDVPIANGIDDIQDQATSTAWSAKTVKWTTKADIIDKIRDKDAKVQLISGRNSPDYSYGISVDPKRDVPDDVAKLILEIWNERVKSVRTKFSTLRTVVMVKCPFLNRIAIFERDTVLYDHQNYGWEWNKNGNLKGYENGKVKFTWQPHGSQFTINNAKIPETALVIDIAPPSKLSLSQILKETGWSKNKFSIQRP